jgi:DNA-binding NarL/FixJ family response regulator
MNVKIRKLLIVDDHAVAREGTQHILKQLDDDLVVFEAHNCREALGFADDHPDLDLILLGLNRPGPHALSPLRELREHHPDLPVAVLPAWSDRDLAISTFHLGAIGCIPKTSSQQVILSAVRLILSGGVYVPRELLTPDGLQDAMSGPVAGPGESWERSERISAARRGLTRRQTEVLALIAQGKPNKLICRQLRLAEGTVKTHVTAILRALNVSSRTQAVIALERAARGRTAGFIKEL